MKRSVKFLLLASLCVSTATFAQKQPVCPSAASIIATIKAEGFDFVARDPHDHNGPWVVAKLKSKFDTENEWSFAVLVGGSNTNAEEAKAAAYTVLPTISYLPDPFERITSDCWYQSTLSWFPAAAASSPPINPSDISVMTKLKRYS